jgi:serine/threonine-protein kinase
VIWSRRGETYTRRRHDADGHAVPLIPGTRLGPYEVVAPLGAGGMGEVYRARDPRLGREVAIKVLPEQVARDPERLARFEREARLLAALGHAGIASIFGVEETGAAPALVMELVEGPTLAERIAQGPLPPEEALPVARQLAEALEYAHEHGIIHRDLKPANVKLRPDGTVKVLDFGLARALEAEASGSAEKTAHSPTLTQGMTRDGFIVGTAGYMAPEQARGRPADRRADVWAFGVVVYEMLAGRLLFVGETTSDTLAAVMRDEPDWSALPPGLSPRWRALLRRCLTKDPRQRLQSIGEARIALEDLASNPVETAPAAPLASAARRPLLPWLVAAAALLALATIGLWPKATPLSVPTELGVVPYGGQKIGLDLGYQPFALSPDGRKLAYTVRQEGTLRLRLRRLDAREDVEMAGAEGARNLFFSPDSEWIGFFDTRKMSKVSVHGGTPVALADSLQDRSAAWLDDGTIVYAREVTEALYRIPDAGGNPIELTKLDAAKRERTHRWPCALDGGPWVVFTAQTVDSPGGYDDASIDAVSVKTGERRHLFQGARRAAWAPGGYLLLARGSDLYAVPIDPKDPRVTQEPVPVLGDVSGDASSGASYFSMARVGTLAWIQGGEPEKEREIGWFDRAGRWTATKIPVGPYNKVNLSADGRRALVSAGPGGGSADLWLGRPGDRGDEPVDARRSRKRRSPQSRRSPLRVFQGRRQGKRDGGGASSRRRGRRARAVPRPQSADGHRHHRGREERGVQRLRHPHRPGSPGRARRQLARTGLAGGRRRLRASGRAFAGREVDRPHLHQDAARGGVRASAGREWRELAALLQGRGGVSGGGAIPGRSSSSAARSCTASPWERAGTS